ncbi:hypothetical protein HY932_02020 [Candidatus Falkowbacteria bacterium]|nr:hypothetical protein [Candidatus Falkowbacteria bacterium]
MRNTTLFAVVLALAAACTFDNPLDWEGLVFAVPDELEDWVADATADAADLQVAEQSDQADQAADSLDQQNEVPTDVPDVPDSQDVKDAKDVDAEVANPCPAEGEYPDPQLMKCLKYPCCELAGSWMLQMVDYDDPMANYNYAVAIEQEKALVVLNVLGRAPGNIKLPETVSGTLESDVLHLDGGDPGMTGFLMMDAKKVEAALFELGTFSGLYKLVINGEPTHSGSWTLTPN